ncbi:hypothetical protein [uncultured Pseudoflavonifractor sp.]|uniref:hypothetical protein n=1 Tax=uncultured Pseudoflavonifractor sp. TaxID=1221379 RepID=UPI0025FF17DB|nr:hypothetical protein [uncultured Pseudoflavonifractor sp.]
MREQYNSAPAVRPSLEERLDRLKKGLVSDSMVLDARLEHMSSFPLADWFGEHRERLEQLSRAFPGITGDMTFGQAADVLWEHRDTRRGAEGMWLLLAPLLDADRYMVKHNDGGAFYWGAR